MRAGWANDYVGLPYAAKGRSRDGVDCWGLVRLVYAGELGIDLPSFTEAYAGADDTTAIAEEIARRREGWASIDVGLPGDVVLFRIAGATRHIGVMVEEGQFLHITRDRLATVETLTGSAWRNRVEGFYRWDETSAGVTIAGLPHPLRPVRVDEIVAPGESLADIRARLGAHGTSAIITVDGREIPVDKWDVVVPEAGQRVEYRAVAADNIWSSVLRLGVVVGAAILAPILAPFLVAMNLGLTLAAATSLAAAGLLAGGTLLVNYLFPTRPAQPRIAQQAAQDNLLQGGSNQTNRFGAVPVVLGQMRYTPPLAAESYVDASGSDSYLNLALCWGYGELHISDIRLGATPIGALEEVEHVNVQGAVGDDLTEFYALYGRDVTQLTVGVQMTTTTKNFTSWTSASGSTLNTVTFPAAHGFTVGQVFSQPAAMAGQWFTGPITAVTSTTLTYDTGVLGPASGGAGIGYGATPIDRTMSGQCSRINVILHFPIGLRAIDVSGSGAGRDFAAEFAATIQVRQLDPVTLVPLGGWTDAAQAIRAKAIALPRAWFNVNADATVDKVYQWTSVAVDLTGKMIVRQGAFTASPTADPSGILLQRLQQLNFGFTVPFTRLPTLGPGEVEIWRFCVFGNTIYSQTDMTAAANVLGCGVTASGRTVTIAAGIISRNNASTIDIGLTGRYLKQVDPFTLNVSMSVTYGLYEMRLWRMTDSGNPDPTNRQYSWDCYCMAITGYSNNKPIAFPQPLALTAIRIRASNQINGTVEGFSGTVISVCPDWDAATSTWITRPTRNPASLYRYVLQHPANARAVPDSAIDLPALQTWHSFCKANNFLFDMVVTEVRSLLDLLRDIAAAGRSSPTFRDGLWSIVTDKAKSTYAQAFTPANSWGFQGSRSYPDLPHAFRVSFNNAQRAYQTDEMIVYNDGYSAANATLFEQLSLPGVTTTAAIFKHARFHYAQLKARPETYTLNADVEHLICQRGDLVKVTHDVPMWGLGSGRIKTYVSTTSLVLDQAMPMAAGTQYTIRIRLADGSMVTRTVAAQASDGLYNTITVTAALTATQGAAGNLFLFGALSAESVDLLVIAIEPTDNFSARLTLVDYAPAVFNSDSETVPTFDSQITRPPKLLQPVITETPILQPLTSDERVMVINANGTYGFRIGAAYTNPPKLPLLAKFVAGEIIDATSTATTGWNQVPPVPLGQAVYFPNVIEGASYKIRLRYVTTEGRTGPWVTSAAHTVIGRGSPPPTMAAATVAVTRVNANLNFALSNLPAQPIDFRSYEFRVGAVRAGATAGDDTPDAIVSGTTDNFWADPDCKIVQSTLPAATISLNLFDQPRYSSAGITYRVAVRMRDSQGNYSAASALSSIVVTSIT